MALYAVYSVDYRLQKSLDGMDDATNSSGVEGLVTPVAAGYTISDRFGPRTPPCSGCSDWHKGIDMYGSDQIVHSVLDGTVIGIGDSSGNNTVSIQHADGLISQYLHMYTTDITVKVGDTVTANQVIGKIGSAGQSTGAHLHFELRISEVQDPSVYDGYSKNPTGVFINPAEYYTQNGVGGFE